MTQRHADIWSHPGHYLVYPYTWPRSSNGQGHIWPWKFKCQDMSNVQTIDHTWGLEFNRYVCFWFRGNRTTFGRDIANSIFDLENSRSRSWPRSNRRVTFEASSSINMFAFLFVAIGPFWLRYSEFHSWPWKFKVKVTTKIDQDIIR